MLICRCVDLRVKMDGGGLLSPVDGIECDLRSDGANDEHRLAFKMANTATKTSWMVVMGVVVRGDCVICDL